MVLLHKQLRKFAETVQHIGISAVNVRIDFIKHAFSSLIIQFLLAKEHLFAENALYQLLSSGITKNSATLVHLITF